MLIIITPVSYTHLDVYKRQHLWFLYSIIGLYLASPIIFKFVKNSKKSEIELMLIMGVIFNTLIPVISKYFYVDLGLSLIHIQMCIRDRNEGSTFKVKLPNVLIEDSPMIIYEFNKANTELELSDIYN